MGCLKNGTRVCGIEALKATKSAKCFLAASNKSVIIGKSSVGEISSERRGRLFFWAQKWVNWGVKRGGRRSSTEKDERGEVGVDMKD